MLTAMPQVGEKFQAATGELLHVIEVGDGLINARVNGTGFVLCANNPDAIAGWPEISNRKISDQEYQNKLDKFWANRDDAETERHE